MDRIIVERTPYIFACCDALVRPEDVASAARFQNESRRREHLAWRRIVRRELGVKVGIAYNDVGAPVVDKPNTYISVAHSSDVVAVAISDRAIGIDIERTTRDFERAKSRYMSPSEASLSTAEHWAAYVWTAKEALYKLLGRRGVELRDDLRIESYDEATRVMLARLVEGIAARVEIVTYEDNIVVAVASYQAD